MGDFDYKEISTTHRQIFIIINDFFIFLFWNCRLGRSKKIVCSTVKSPATI